MTQSIPSQYYAELQKLHRFMQFIASLEYTNEKQRQLLGKIQDCITNIDKPETHKDWNVCLDICDQDIQYRTTDRQGIYMRTWTVFCNQKQLEIEMAFRHSQQPFYSHELNNLITISFGNQNKLEQIELKSAIDKFVADAQNYRSYITEHLNDVTTSIEID